MKSIESLILIFFLIGLTVSCASVPDQAGSASFAEYAEQVFRHQNKLISEIMSLADSEEIAESASIEQSEQAMRDACHLLNEYAEHEMNGETLGLQDKVKLQNSIQGCERSVNQLESMLSLMIKDHQLIH
jgi:hypothetical protein